MYGVSEKRFSFVFFVFLKKAFKKELIVNNDKRYVFLKQILIIKYGPIRMLSNEGLSLISKVGNTFGT